MLSQKRKKNNELALPNFSHLSPERRMRARARAEARACGIAGDNFRRKARDSRMEEKSSRLDEFRLRNNHTWNHAIRIIYTLARYAASSLQNHECARDFRQRTRVRLAASMEAASARNNATLSLLTFSPPIPRSILPLYYTVQFRAVSSSPVIYSDGSLHASGALS